MQCPQCGTTIPEGSRQCPNCNYLLEDASQSDAHSVQQHGAESIIVVDSVDIAQATPTVISQKPENWFTYQRKEHPWRTVSGFAVAAIAAFILINFVLTNLLNVPLPIAVFRPTTVTATPHLAISTTHAAPATLVVTQATATPIPPTRTPTPRSTVSPKQTATPSPSPTPTPTPAPVAVALSQFFNNTGASFDNATNGANFDGEGYSYSLQALSSVGLSPGASISIDNVTFDWPQISSALPNNVFVNGQTIPLNAPASTQTIGFLGASANRASTGTGTITYADGTTQSFTLSFSDWALDGQNTPLFPGEVIVKQMDYRNAVWGRDHLAVYVFFTQITVPGGKGIQSITLPNNLSGGQMHIFAISSH